MKQKDKRTLIISTILCGALFGMAIVINKVDSCICLYVNPPDKLGCYLSPTHSPEWTRALSYAAQISMFSNIATK